MKMVGVLDLRQNLAKYLDRVAEQGESLVIVQRSKPVARLIPYREKLMSEDEASTAELQDLALFLADNDTTEAARLLAQAAADLLKANADAE